MSTPVTSQNISFVKAIDRLVRILKHKQELALNPRDDRQQYFLSLDVAALELALAYLQRARETEGVVNND